MFEEIRWLILNQKSPSPFWEICCSEAIAVLKKLKLRDELSKELVLKAELFAMQADLKADIAVFKAEIKFETRMYFLILVSAMIILNRDALTLIGQLLGLIK